MKRGYQVLLASERLYVSTGRRRAPP